MATIISVSSQVVRGHVGNSTTVFTCQRLGHEVWAADTVMLPFHPGHGPGHRVITDAADLGALLRALTDKLFFGRVDAVISGYLANAGQAAAVAALVTDVKAYNSKALYLCDPILGDDGSLYVSVEVADAVKRDLVPLADILTPNLFELGILTQTDPKDAPAALAACARLTAPRCLVTSTPGFLTGSIGTLLATKKGGVLAQTQELAQVPKGTGDALAALFLSHLLNGRDDEDALERASSSLFDLLARTVKRGGDELALIEEQDALMRALAPVNIHRLPLRPVAP